MDLFDWPGPAVPDPEWDEDVQPAEIQGCIQPGHGLGWEPRSPGCWAPSSCSSHPAPEGPSDEDTLLHQGLNPVSFQATFILGVYPRHWAGREFHSAPPGWQITLWTSSPCWFSTDKRALNHSLNILSLKILNNPLISYSALIKRFQWISQ